MNARILKKIIGKRVLVLAALLAGSVTLVGANQDRPLEPLPFDHILRFDEMSRLLQEWAEARPETMALESLGRTPEGRDIWFVTLTHQDTGPASGKPAIVVDGNMHASEWAGGVAALHFVRMLLRDDGSDPDVTRLLDTRAVYVLPRMTPDGVEATLEQGRFIRSVDRPAPEGPAAPGIYPRDLDGDGRVVFMRYRDPNGPWKKYPKDPRLMVPRGPGDSEGQFWRVQREGTILGYDGATFADPPPREPLDFGRNFPADLRGAPRGDDAGPYPGSEPEVAAYMAAIAERENIVAHVTLHTFGGLVLTPPVNMGENLPNADKRVYDAVAGKAAELTGYEAMSYLDLRSQDRETYLPSAFGWIYNQRGIYSYIIELWNPLKAAGISLEERTASDWLWGNHPIADEVKLLRWSDRELDGQGFVAWHDFEHPQLGPVQIGGFDLLRYWYNVPFDRLRGEVEPVSRWLAWLGLSTPRLAVRSFEAEPVAGNIWRVRLQAENRGWLPTNGAQKAVEQNVSEGVVAELSLPDSARLVEGGPRRELGELAGRTRQLSTATWWSFAAGTPDRAAAEWLVEAPAGTELSVTVGHDRAGTDRAKVVLGEAGS